MDEARWQRCTDPGPMLALIRRRVGERKLRLFAVACCRRLEPLTGDGRSRVELEVAERLADGLACEQERRAALVGEWSPELVEQIRSGKYFIIDVAPPAPGVDPRLPDCALELSCERLHSVHWRAVAQAALSRQAWERALNGREQTEWHVLTAAERAEQAHLARCVFGNPFRRPAVDPRWLAWNGGTVADMARSIYEERRWEEMPFLADALEEAGCDDEGMLSHCRSGQHARGCWVVDLVLGKE